ncbi:MAG: TetR/AcrR family transcriptional regulator [Pleomorphochaeta sp.]
MAKEATRNKILEAAEDLFSKNGFDGVTTKQIAKLANVTEMTLFNHFENKSLLYKTVVKEKYFSIKIDDKLEELTYTNLELDLKFISTIIINSYIENKQILAMRLKEKESFHNDKLYSIEFDPILKQVTPIFIKYSKTVNFKLDAEYTAKLFIITLKGICHICLLDNMSTERLTTLIYDYVNTFCHGIEL